MKKKGKQNQNKSFTLLMVLTVVFVQCRHDFMKGQYEIQFWMVREEANSNDLLCYVDVHFVCRQFLFHAMNSQFKLLERHTKILCPSSGHESARTSQDIHHFKRAD